MSELAIETVQIDYGREKRLRRRIKLLTLALILSVIVLGGTAAYATSYLVKSNTAHYGFSLNFGTPLQASIIGATGNGTSLTYQVSVMDASDKPLTGLFFNTTMDLYPLGTSFRLNGVSGFTWLNGPYSLVPNQVMYGNFTLGFTQNLGAYDIAVNIVQQ